MRSFSLDTVAYASISSKRGLGELRSMQPRLSLPELTIESISVLINDFLLSLDRSDRFEPANQVEVIVGRAICEEANVEHEIWKINQTHHPYSLYPAQQT
jgi:hypothetical protein